MSKTVSKTAEQAMAEIEAAAARHGAEPRFVRTMGESDVVRQGDVYLTRMAKAPSAEACGAERGSRQVAVGTTVGSRHVAKGAVRVVERVGARVLDGPYVHATERWTLTHPEHAHVSMPEGWYAIHYQEDMATRRAVAD